MDVGLLIVRVVIGLLFAVHGTQKLFGWFGGYGLQGTAGFMGQLRYRQPQRRGARRRACSRRGPGCSSPSGFLTPLAAAAVIGVMINAIVSAKLKQGLIGGYELDVLYASAAAGLAFTGAGTYSVDNVLREAFGWALAGTTWGVIALASRRRDRDVRARDRAAGAGRRRSERPRPRKAPRGVTVSQHHPPATRREERRAPPFALSAGPVASMPDHGGQMDIRPITPDEYVPFYSTFWRSMNFGPPSDETIERDKKAFLYERSLAAFDDGDVVGTAHSHLFDLTLPGLQQVNAAGVTAISTASTHRRRGIVTELKRRQLSEAHERGEAAAVLLASEGRIYGRFGYGAAAMCADIEMRTKDTQFAAPNSGGRVRIVDGETADKVFPSVFSAACRARAGSIDRPSVLLGVGERRPRQARRPPRVRERGG